jgi:nucleoside-diphosphate-sugar epimerase
MPKQALVTGGMGFVGRHIIKELENRNFRVLSIDIVDGNDAIKYFQRGTDRFDLVVHCAYVVGGRVMIDGRNTALIENTLLDSSMFDWALRTRQKAVLYFSSSAAYPTSLQSWHDFMPLKEQHIDLDPYPWFPEIMPDANYGWAKLTGERLAKVAGENGLRVHVVRPFSGYAEDQSFDYPFPSILRRAVRGEFEVWGPKGQTRDWIHIDDVVNGALAVYDADERRPVNLCTGIGTEMGELMMLAHEVLTGDADCDITYLTDKPTGVFYRVGDPSRLNEIYTPKISIEDGVQRAIQKFR